MSEKKEKPWLEEARRLREQGMSYREIGEIVGRSRNIVSLNLNPVRMEARKKRNKEDKTKYYQRHRDRVKDRVHRWYKENREYALEMKKQYRDTHRDKLRADQRAYAAAHPDMIVQYSAERKARVRKASIAGDRKEREEIYRIAREEEGVICYICGNEIPLGHRHVDHVVPLIQHGLHCSSNMRIACDVCNLRKNRKTLEEFKRTIADVGEGISAPAN